MSKPRQKRGHKPQAERESAAKEHEPFEGRQIGREEPAFRGAEQRGPGMSEGRGAAGPRTEE